jgi:hypothetical protein
MSRSTLRYAAVKVMSDKEFREIVASGERYKEIMVDFELDEREVDALTKLAAGEKAELALAEFFDQALPY